MRAPDRDVLGAERVGNFRAVKLYARAGFRVEGLLCAEQIYQGRPVDWLRLALIANGVADSVQRRP